MIGKGLTDREIIETTVVTRMISMRTVVVDKWISMTINTTTISDTTNKALAHGAAVKNHLTTTAATKIANSGMTDLIRKMTAIMAAAFREVMVIKTVGTKTTTTKLLLAEAVSDKEIMKIGNRAGQAATIIKAVVATTAQVEETAMITAVLN